MTWGPDVETNLAISSSNHLKVRFIQQSRIAKQKQVTEAIKNGVVGAISGSAVVKLIGIHHQQSDILLAKLKQFVSQMKMATQK
ncbi:hypothetical protein E3U36_10655 [Arsenophonus endosymbiont of Aphis craccivora]|uniref:tryptophan synthase subunit alpha n=1 Tax=Arsenophonus endosymbiont of Aphis craccivora TaxID=1231049 RepID=UPI0015DD5105|nr:tryptophan synthase subunit alpha [Arsenophonus endosymbiont of Aphis craccivora]QLK88389.1 hypothetical protein E3U36_10655 [Arsenophonus endosymbiont of Aphis craccivora]